MNNPSGFLLSEHEKKDVVKQVPPNVQFWKYNFNFGMKYFVAILWHAKLFIYFMEHIDLQLECLLLSKAWQIDSYQDRANGIIESSYFLIIWS